MDKDTLQTLKMLIVSTYQKAGDEPMLVSKGVKYSGNQIADNVFNETAFGIKIMNSLIKLTIDLVKRDKLNIDM